MVYLLLWRGCKQLRLLSQLCTLKGWISFTRGGLWVLILTVQGNDCIQTFFWWFLFSECPANSLRRQFTFGTWPLLGLFYVFKSRWHWDEVEFCYHRTFPTWLSIMSLLYRRVLSQWLQWTTLLIYLMRSLNIIKIMYIKFLASSRGSIDSSYGYYYFFQYAHNSKLLYLSKLDIKSHKNDSIPMIDSLIFFMSSSQFIENWKMQFVLLKKNEYPEFSMTLAWIKFF